ncbi:MAG TPA: glycosyltransferase family 4 protein [Chitinophagaceae bacterium]|nr:glycosyltransferase family 4 protein [Chitinophagaceae bacterium]
MLHCFSIAQVIDQLETGGAERVLIDLSNILQKHGHAVKVITLVKPGELASQLNENIEQVCLQRKWKYNPAIMYRLVQQLKDCDIIHVHSYYNYRYLFIAAALFGLRKKIFFHEHHYAERSNEGAGLIKKFILQKAIFIGVSQRLCKWAENIAGIEEKKIFLLKNIIQKQNISAIQKQNNNSLKLFVASNVSERKNIAFAIDVCKAMLQSGRKTVLTIVGKIADENYYKLLHQKIADNSLEQHITFIHDCNNIQPLLPHYDLALHTAFSESGPLVLIEYMAQGLPFITYNTGETVQQVQHDLPGCIMNSFELKMWIEKIKALLNADRKTTQILLSKVFEKYFSEDAYYEQCIKIYEKGIADTA